MKKFLIFLALSLFITLESRVSTFGKSSERHCLVDSATSESDTPALFPEGKFDEYLTKHVKFPKIYNADGETFLFLNIEISQSGVAKVIKISSKISPAVNQAFTDAVNGSPRWKPATSNGKPTASMRGFGFTVSFDRKTGNVRAVTHHFAGNRNMVKSDNTIYTRVQKPPHFPGGEQSLIYFLNRNIRRPKGVHGVALVQFVVEQDGSLTDFKLLRTINGETSKEALRLFSLFPKWIPGVNESQVVRTQTTVPIRF